MSNLSDVGHGNIDAIQNVSLRALVMSQDRLSVDASVSQLAASMSATY